MFTLATTLNLLPIWLVKYPPLADYPNHLARCYLIAHLDDEASHLGDYYQLVWNLYPNLAGDLLIPLFHHWFPIQTAGKLFLSVYAVFLPFAVLFLIKAVRPVSLPLAVVPFMFVYNFHFLSGFLNYCMSLVFFFFALGTWLRWREHLTAWRIGWLSALLFATYLSHIHGYVALMIALVAFEAGSRERWRRIGQILIVGSPSLLAMIWWMLSLSRLNADNPIGYDFDLLAHKARTILGPIRTYGDIPDVVTALLLGTAVLLWLRRPVFESSQWRTAMVVLLGAFLLIPSNALTGTSADDRLLLVVYGMGLAALSLHPRREHVWGGVLILFLCFRSVWITSNWLSYDGVMRNYEAGWSSLPRGARILPVAFMPPGWSLRTSPELHAYGYAVIERQAFVPTLFAIPNQQPLRVLRPFTTQYPTRNGEFEFSQVRDFDFLWTVRSEGRGNIASFGELVFESGDLRIYCVRRKSGVNEGGTIP